MPYCCQCGTPSRPSDIYCAKCGARQPLASEPRNYLNSISPRIASLLCYVPVLGWIAAIVVLASATFRQDLRVRFHAFQGLYLFVAWLLVDWVIDPMFRFSIFPGTEIHRIVPNLLRAVVFGAWIFMMVKVSQDESYKLPVLGDLAEKSVSEQR